MPEALGEGGAGPPGGAGCRARGGVGCWAAAAGCAARSRFGGCRCPGARESRCVTGADAWGSWGLPAPADSSESPAVRSGTGGGECGAGRGRAVSSPGRLRRAEPENPKAAAGAPGPAGPGVGWGGDGWRLLGSPKAPAGDKRRKQVLPPPLSPATGDPRLGPTPLPQSRCAARPQARVREGRGFPSPRRTRSALRRRRCRGTVLALVAPRSRGFPPPFKSWSCLWEEVHQHPEPRRLHSPPHSTPLLQRKLHWCCRHQV